jgi:nitrate reductase gamma subunit
MESWLEWARGPAFVFAFTFMVLGLIRHVVLTLAEMHKTMRRAGDKSLAYSKLLVTTLKWLVPVAKIRTEFVYSITSILFHMAILIVPIFLVGHIALWARGVGLSWPGIPGGVADVLTIIAIVTAVALVLQRVSARATRCLSRFQDYALPLLIAVPFVTGFLVMHPAINPFSYEAVLFVHVMSANLIFVLMPITKLSHAAFMPSLQFVSELGWKWPSDSGSRVAAALRKEAEPV